MTNKQEISCFKILSLKKSMIKLVFQLFILSLIIILPVYCFSQNNEAKINKDWTIGNPIRNNVFIENLGQFDDYIQTSEKIKFTAFQGEGFYFISNGLIYDIGKAVIPSERELEKVERKLAKKDLTHFETESEVRKTFKKEQNLIKMEWLGSNSISTIETSL